MVDDSDFVEVPDNIRAYEDAGREALCELYPIRIGSSVLADDLVEDDPGIINMKPRVLEKQSLDHLFIEGRVHSTRDSAVAEYHLHTREFPEDFFQFVQILRTVSDPGSGNIVMYGYRQSMRVGKLENRV